MRLFNPIPVILSILLVSLLSGCAMFNREEPEDPRADWTAEQFYIEAKTALNRGRYSAAIETYTQLLGRFPFGPVAEQAHLDRTYALYKNDDPVTALAEIDRFIRLHPTHQYIDYAYYLRGLIHTERQAGLMQRILGQIEQADSDPRSIADGFEAFRELVQRFPDSIYADDAAQRMAYLAQVMAEHEIRVARYYMDMEAYVAVVNRCKYVLEHFQQTPAAEDALGMMIIAYNRMGYEDLASDTRRVLQANFPNSRYLRVASASR